MKSEMLSEKIVKPLKNKEKESQPIYANSLILLVPGTRIELVRRWTPRDFKSLASTYSATQAHCQLCGISNELDAI